MLPLHYKGKALSERPNKLSALILKSSLFKNLLFNLLCTGVENIQERFYIAKNCSFTIKALDATYWIRTSVFRVANELPLFECSI